jgi:hypothetical protein
VDGFKKVGSVVLRLPLHSMLQKRGSLAVAGHVCGFSPSTGSGFLQLRFSHLAHSTCTWLLPMIACCCCPGICFRTLLLQEESCQMQWLSAFGTSSRRLSLAQAQRGTTAPLSPTQSHAQAHPCLV